MHFQPPSSALLCSPFHILNFKFAYEVSLQKPSPEANEMLTTEGLTLSSWCNQGFLKLCTIHFMDKIFLLDFFFKHWFDTRCHMHVFRVWNKMLSAENIASLIWDEENSRIKADKRLAQPAASAPMKSLSFHNSCDRTLIKIFCLMNSLKGGLILR